MGVGGCYMIFQPKIVETVAPICLHRHVIYIVLTNLLHLSPQVTVCLPDQFRCVMSITDLITYLLLLFHLYFSNCLLCVRWGEECLGIGGYIYVHLHGAARS